MRNNGNFTMRNKYYWVVLWGLLVLALAGCPPEELKPEYPPPDDPIIEDDTDFVASAVEQRAYELVNLERVNQGLSPLVMTGDLHAVALAHSEDMATNDYFSHTNLFGLSPFERLDYAGIAWVMAGENLAYNGGFADPAATAVDSWMNSPSHRSNILTAAYTHTGMGVVSVGDVYYFTQVFIRRGN